MSSISSSSSPPPSPPPVTATSFPVGPLSLKDEEKGVQEQETSPPHKSPFEHDSVSDFTPSVCGSISMSLNQMALDHKSTSTPSYALANYQDENDTSEAGSDNNMDDCGDDDDTLGLEEAEKPNLPQSTPSSDDATSPEMQFGVPVQDSYEKYMQQLDNKLRLQLVDDPNRNNPETAITYHGMAVVRYFEGRYEEAVEMLKTALEIRNQNVKRGEDHHDSAIMETLRDLELVYYRQGRLDEARRIRPKTSQKEAKAATYRYQGRTLFDEGNYAEALTAYRKALVVEIEALGASNTHPLQ